MQTVGREITTIEYDLKQAKLRLRSQNNLIRKVIPSQIKNPMSRKFH